MTLGAVVCLDDTANGACASAAIAAASVIAILIPSVFHSSVVMRPRGSNRCARRSGLRSRPPAAGSISITRFCGRVARSIRFARDTLRSREQTVARRLGQKEAERVEVFAVLSLWSTAVCEAWILLLWLVSRREGCGEAV